jgi:RimJ/RimL family protein N-acetyltransferase
MCRRGVGDGPLVDGSGSISVLSWPPSKPSSEKGRAALRRTTYYAILECLRRTPASFLFTDSFTDCAYAVSLAARSARLPAVVLLDSAQELTRFREIETPVKELIFRNGIQFVVPDFLDSDQQTEMPNVYRIPGRPRENHLFGNVIVGPQNLFLPISPQALEARLVNVSGLLLCPLQSSHFEQLRLLRNKAISRSGFIDDRILDSDESEAYLHRRVSNPVAPIFGIFDARGEIVGSVGWHYFWSAPGVLEITSLLLDHRKDSQSRGQMTVDSLRFFWAVMDFIQRISGASVLIARVFADNPKCLALCRRLGFCMTGESQVVQSSGASRRMIHLRCALDAPMVPRQVS